LSGLSPLLNQQQTTTDLKMMQTQTTMRRIIFWTTLLVFSLQATSAAPIGTSDLHLSGRAEIKNVLMDPFGGAPIDYEPFVT
jgi:hypothetical protein